MSEPRGILAFLDDAREIQKERGCSFGEALEIWQRSREPQPEPENVIRFRPRGSDGMA